jgi:primase-polymerase (primpol)-like protein
MTTPTIPKPVPLTVRPENIPDEMKSLPQWVMWRYVWLPSRGKWDKPPYKVRLKSQEFASSTDPKTWDTFGAALAVYQTAPELYDGIGFVPIKDGPYTFVDLDHCVEDGFIAEWALEIVRKFSSYTELSPSGTGLRIITRSPWPFPEKQGTKKGNIELYHSGHYLTITGHCLDY